MVVMVLCMGYSIVTYIQLFVNVQNKNTKAYKMALDTTFGHSFVDLDYTAHSSIVRLDQM